MRRAHNFIDETGKRYGKLLVLHIYDEPGIRRKYTCVCDCGKTVNVLTSNLRKGNSKSCGCAGREATKKANTTHGYTANYNRSRTYTIWVSIRRRVGQLKWYKDVRLCPRWEKFENFLEDMGEAPDGLTLDRFPNNKGDYEPGNCRWANWEEQQNNRTNNRIITYKGETKTLAEWCKGLKLNYPRVHARLSLGWAVDRAFETPVQGPTVSNLRARHRVVKSENK